MNLNDFFVSTLDSLTMATNKLNRNINNNSTHENNLFNNFLKELNNFLYRNMRKN